MTSRRSSTRSPSGRAEFANGSRLVYGVEPGAMRFLNLLGNKAFSLVFTALIGQPVKDTLCGTKALKRSRYEEIAAGRAYFGDFDPFGDFDLLLGASRLQLRIVDVPGAVPLAHLRRDEDLALPARLAARSDGGVRLPQAEDPDLQAAEAGQLRRRIQSAGTLPAGPGTG